MRRLATGFALVSALFLCDARESEGRGQECPTVALAAILEVRGLRGLFEEVELGLVSAPRVSSRWFYVKNNLDAPCWNEDRSFFGDMVAHVEIFRTEVVSLPADELREAVGVLSGLADWVAKSEGYSNLLVEVRLRALMAQGIGQVILAAKGEVPTWVDGSIDAIVPTLSDPNARARVLNNEARVVFVRTPISDGDLRLYWGAQEYRALSTFAGTPPPDSDSEISKKLASWGMPGEDGEVLYASGFFQDETCAGRTTFACWDKKQHGRIALLGFPRREPLRALLEFRRTVGFIPPPISSDSRRPLAGLEIYTDHWQQRVGFGERREIATLSWSASRGVRRGYFDDGEYDFSPPLPATQGVK